MHTLQDPKAMAKALRQALAAREIDLSHADALECVARQLGWRDWNTLAARLERPALRLPAGWLTSGTHAEQYEMGVEPGEESTGTALIRSKPGLLQLHPDERPTGFGTLMQSVTAERFRGQRLRLSGELRTQGVTGSATMWLRVDGADRRTLAFDNMESRTADGALEGSVGWRKRAIVLDVGADAASVNFGFFLRGHGAVWARAFELTAVAPSVPTTVEVERRPAEPVNLGFTAAGQA